MAIKAFSVFGELFLDKGKVVADIKDVEKRAVTAAKNIEKNFGEGFKRGFGQAGDALEEIGVKAGKVAGLISNPFAVAAAAVTGFALTMKSATQAALAFDEQFQKSAVFLSSTPGQINAIEQSLRGLDARLGSAAELLPTFRKALLDSADPKVALEMTKLAAAFAKVTDTTPTQAVGLLGDLMDSFGIKADKARRITDVLFLTMQQGGGDVAELAANFPRLADAAAESNIQIEELGAALATLGQVAGSSPQKNIQALILLLTQLTFSASKFRERGVDVSGLVAQFGELGGRLRAIRQFATDAETGLLSKERLRELGVSGRNLNATLKLISDEGLAVLAQKTATFNRDAPGATASAFKQISATVGEQFSRLATEIDKIKERIGAPILIPIRFAIESAADVLEQINRGPARSGAGILRPGRRRLELPEAERRRQEQRAAFFERNAGGGIDSGIPPPEGQRAAPVVEGPNDADRAAERALQSAIRGRINADAAAVLEARGRSAGRAGRTQLNAQSAVQAALQFERDLETETAKLQERSIQGTEQFFDRKVQLRRQAAEIEKRIIADTSAADIAAARERIKGLDAEIATQRKRTQPGGDSVGGAARSTVDTTIEGLLQQRDAARRQITELTEKSTDDRRSAEQRLVTDLIGLDKERVSSLRSAMQDEFAREKTLAEQRFALRRALNQASLTDEIQFWAGAAEAAKRAGKTQMDELLKVAALVRQQRDEARGVASEQLSAVESILQEQGVDPEFARLNNVQIENLLQRRRIRDEDINARANAGQSVGLKSRQGALGRLGLFERGEQAGGFGQAMRDATSNVAEKFREAMATLPDVANNALGKVVESFAKHYEELERLTRETIGKIAGEIGKLAQGPGGGAGGDAKLSGTGTKTDPFTMGTGPSSLSQLDRSMPGLSRIIMAPTAAAAGKAAAAQAKASPLTSPERRAFGLPPGGEFALSGQVRGESTEDLISRQAREARKSGLFGPEHFGPFNRTFKPEFGGLPPMLESPGGEFDLSSSQQTMSSLVNLVQTTAAQIDSTLARGASRYADSMYRHVSRRIADDLTSDLDRMVA